MQSSGAVDFDIPSHTERSPNVLGRSSAQSPSGYLVPLKALTVTFGAFHGESPVSADDFIAGDALKLRQESATAAICFDDLGAREMRVIFHRADIGQREMIAHLTGSLTLMSTFGQVIYARVLHVPECADAASFVLLEECLDPSVEYTLIEVAG